jgi:trk system potassium uptake protein TrkA
MLNLNGNSRYVVVAGCGRLGSMLANSLSAGGHRVVVMDERESAFERLSQTFSGYTVLGNVVDRSTLEEGKIRQADYFLAVTAQDNVNLMVAQVAKVIYGVPHVLARVYDPVRESLYREFGVQTISPVQLSADAFLDSCQLLTRPKL